MHSHDTPIHHTIPHLATQIQDAILDIARFDERKKQELTEVIGLEGSGGSRGKRGKQGKRGKRGRQDADRTAGIEGGNAGSTAGESIYRPGESITIYHLVESGESEAGEGEGATVEAEVEAEADAAVDVFLGSMLVDLM
jgi:hypothetical protein